MRLALLAVLLILSSACTAPLRPTLLAVQDPELLTSAHGTLTYIEDEELHVVPVAGGRTRRIHTDERPTRVGGIDGKGRIVYAHEWVDRLLLIGWKSENKTAWRYEIRVINDGKPEQVIAQSAGNVLGMAVSTDGRVAIAVREQSTIDGEAVAHAMHIVDLDTHAKQSFALKPDDWSRELHWSRDERSVLYITDESPSGTNQATLTALDADSGEQRTLFLTSNAVPVIDSDGFAVLSGASFQVLDERGSVIRPARALIGALPRIPSAVIAAPSADRIIYFGLPPSGTDQRRYYQGELAWGRMWSVHIADVAKPGVATIVEQMHTTHVTFSPVDLMPARFDSSPPGPRIASK